MENLILPTGRGVDPDNPFQPSGNSPFAAMKMANKYAFLLPAEVRTVWIELASYYPNIFPSNDRLAADLSINKRTVSYHLKKLNNIGAVTTQREGTGHRSKAWRRLELPGLYAHLGAVPVDEDPPWTVEPKEALEAERLRQAEVLERTRQKKRNIVALLRAAETQS